MIDLFLLLAAGGGGVLVVALVAFAAAFDMSVRDALAFCWAQIKGPKE